MSRKNITIALDDETARWARIEAARRETSVSRLLAGFLRELMLSEQSYDSAMADYLSRQPKALKASGDRYPAREEVHDRAGLR